MSGSTGLDRGALDAATNASFDRLLRALELERLDDDGPDDDGPDDDGPGDDRFRVGGEPGQFDNTFGGQLVAQALVAAGATVDGKVISSFHSSFTSAGNPVEPVDLIVRRTRDGRTMATREVSLEQDGRSVLTAIVSFHHDLGGDELIGGSGPESELAAEPESGPTALPLFQEWVAGTPRATGSRASSWIDRPPPVEMRIGEPPTFLGGAQAAGPRSHWMRAPHVLSDSPLHPVLLAHASDYLMLDMAFRAHAVPYVPGRFFGTSLDHSVCFHRPVRFDRWHRHTMEVVALTGERGLVRGTLHDQDGHLVASVAQEVLVRVTDQPTGG